jgi:hypothetical protein
VISILNILKEFGLSRTSATRSEKTGSSGTSPRRRLRNPL